MRKCQLLGRLYNRTSSKSGEAERSSGPQLPSHTTFPQEPQKWLGGGLGIMEALPGIREAPTKNGSFPIHPSDRPCSQSDPSSRMASNFIPHSSLILLGQVIVPCLNLELAPSKGPLQCEALRPAFGHHGEQLLQTPATRATSAENVRCGPVVWAGGEGTGAQGGRTTFHLSQPGSDEAGFQPGSSEPNVPPPLVSSSPRLSSVARPAPGS